MRKKCCFLDRDGVVNVEMHYLHEADKVVLESGVIEALKILKDNNFLIVVITNQAGVAKGYYPEEDISKVHDKIQELLALHNLAIDKFYYCPHHPDFTGECSCRKPNIGMIMQAVDDFDIDLAQSYFVGDRLSDINAGKNAKCLDSILVKTGYGKKILESEDCSQIHVADNLLQAVNRYIVNKCQ